LRKLFLLRPKLFSKLRQILLLFVSLSTIVSDREMLGRRPLLSYGHLDMVGVVRLRIKSYSAEPSRGKGILLGTQPTLVALPREFLD
jgi:hypothetical protein